MDAPRHRRAAGGGDDDGSEHELSLFPGALRRRHVFFPQAVDRDERRAGRAGRLLVRALGALPAFRLSAPGARPCLPDAGARARRRREPRRRAALADAPRFCVSALGAGQAGSGFLSGPFDGQERAADPHFLDRRAAASDRQRHFRAAAFARARLRHRADPDDAGLFHAVHRRRARAPSARHRADGAAGAGLRDDHGRVSAAPADELSRSVERRGGQRLSRDSIFDRLRLGPALGPRSGREPAKTFLSARGAHGSRLLGGRRGARSFRRAHGAGALRRDQRARPQAHGEHRRALRSVSRLRPDAAARTAGADPHGRGHGPDADQGAGAAVYQLRRLGDGDQSDGGGNFTGAVAPAAVAMRVIFAGGGTGGHLFPGLAVAREFQRRDPMTEILFMGTSQGIEYRVLPKEGFRLETLPVRGLKGRGLRGVIDALYGVPASLFRSLRILRDFRPDCVIGLGGYASGPALLAAKLAGVRSAIMEQNLRPGFTNKLLGRWVDRVFTAYPGSAAFFPGARVVESGNPVRWQKLPEVEKRGQFSLLIFGGSLGARRINFAVIDALKQLSDLKAEIFITHQTGELDFAAIRAAYDALPFQAEVIRFIDRMDEAYARADLIVCRAGATTVA